MQWGFQPYTKFQTTSGKRFSSRIIRKSTVTISIKADSTTDADRRHLAKTMSHSVNTENEHYDEHTSKDSSLQCLAKYNTHTLMLDLHLST